MFEIGDCLADRRLGDCKLFGSATEATFFDDRRQDSNFVTLDVHASSLTPAPERLHLSAISLHLPVEASTYESIRQSYADSRALSIQA